MNPFPDICDKDCQFFTKWMQVLYLVIGKLAIYIQLCVWR